MPILSANALRCLPTSGLIPLPAAAQVKREYEGVEGGEFLQVRRRASTESVTAKQLREKCVLLRGGEGMLACHNNPAAADVLRKSIQGAIGDEDWRELWVLLAQLERWLQVMSVAGANTCWPFWLRRSDEPRAGDTPGTAVPLQDMISIDIQDDSSPTMPTVHVKQEQATERASLEHPQERPIAAAAIAVVQPGARARRHGTSCEPTLSVQQFPVGIEVLTPRVDGDGEYFSYCTVLSHREGQLRVEIPGEAPYNLSLHTLKRTGDKWGRPLSRPAGCGADVRPANEMASAALALPTAEQQPSAPVVKAVPPLDAREAVAAPKMTSTGETNGKRKASALEDASDTNRPATKPFVKLENEDKSIERKVTGRAKDAHTLAREATRAKWQVTPSGMPRKTFAAGCQPRCLTHVLGGVGTDMMRVVNNDFFDVHGHKLTGVGDLYIWGRADWNPWAPSFAGDDGLYLNDLGSLLRHLAEMYGKEEVQVQFHLFRQCTERENIDLPYSAWHGKRAAGKTIYCGVYQVPDDIPPGSITFNEFPNYTQAAHARLSWKKRHGTTGEPTAAQVASEEQHLLTKPALKDDSSKWRPTSAHIGEVITIMKSGDIKIPNEALPYPVKWLGCEPPKKAVEDRILRVEQHVGGTVELQSGLKFANPLYRYCMFPVQCVGYSEEVYSELERIHADNGVVETDDDRLGIL